MNFYKTMLAIVLFMPFSHLSRSQDTLNAEVLAPMTYSFNIVNGELRGPGAEFLRSAFAKSQYTLLGEYHGSRRISEFTRAIIPILDSVGYDVLVVETGPESGKYLNRLPNQRDSVIRGLNRLNRRYLMKEDEDFVVTPIPFFDTEEDAIFLGEAKEAGWNVMGIDQEFITGFIMLSDWMYDNLSKRAQKKYKNLHEQIKDTLFQYYVAELKGGDRFSVAVSKSEPVAGFLEKMSEADANLPIIDAWNKSIEIYRFYAERKWFKNNSTRIRYMKEQLANGFKRLGFDLSEDRALVKMGGYHTGRGFSPLALYEVGNTLNELAEFNGNRSLYLTFSSRYYMEAGELKDRCAEEGTNVERLRPLTCLGEENRWVLIDLRPLVEGKYYYPRKYEYNEHVERLVKRYDLLIIPEVEIEGSPNY